MEQRNIYKIIQEDAKPPFKEELIDTEWKERIKTFIIDPEKIVRIKFRIAGETPLEVSLDYLNTGRELLKELRDIYDIPMPNFEFVIGYDGEKRQTGYTITERIHGKNFIEIDFDPEERKPAREKIDNALLCVVTYLQSIYNNPRRYLTDIYDGEQWVYGKKKDDREPQAYFVDLDYYHRNLSSFSNENDKKFVYRRFFYCILSLADNILRTEEKLAAPLTKTRQQLSKFLSSMESSDPNYYIIQRVMGKVTL